MDRYDSGHEEAFSQTVAGSRLIRQPAKRIVGIDATMQTAPSFARLAPDYPLSAPRARLSSLPGALCRVAAIVLRGPPQCYSRDCLRPATRSILRKIAHREDSFGLLTLASEAKVGVTSLRVCSYSSHPRPHRVSRGSLLPIGGGFRLCSRRRQWRCAAHRPRYDEAQHQGSHAARRYSVDRSSRT